VLGSSSLVLGPFFVLSSSSFVLEAVILDSTASSTGVIIARRFARMTVSHNGSNFFQPVA
jgi:hypothetical protein